MNEGAKVKVGLLGGTFNPVHQGHLILAQSALETYDLSRVLFVPCSTPPHKRESGLLSAEHRLAMLEAAVEGDLRFEVCDEEVRRGGTSYSVDTVRALTREEPACEFFFIIGADTIVELHLWREIYTLLSLCRFVTFDRPGRTRDAIRQEDLRLDPPWPRKLLEDFTSGRAVDISSSDIRHRIAEGMSIRYLVPQAVEMYIAEHRLYEN